VPCALVTAGVVLLTVIVLVLAGHECGPSMVQPAARIAIALASTARRPLCAMPRHVADHLTHVFEHWCRVLADNWRPPGLLTPAAPPGVLLAVVAGVFGIRAYPHPTIDDWNILQGCAEHCCTCRTIYGQAWPGARGHLLPYLPASAVLLTPFYLVFSDVRYGPAGSTRAGRTGRRPAEANRPFQHPLVLSGWSCSIVVMYGIEDSCPSRYARLIPGMVLAIERGRPGLRWCASRWRC